MRTKRKTVAVRTVLSLEVFRKLESAAAENCRTVSQEVAFRIQRQFLAPQAGAGPFRIPEDPWTPERHEAVREAEVSEPFPETSAEVSPWTPEQETAFAEKSAAAGMSPAQASAHRIIQPDFEAAMASLAALEPAPA